jgi:hypothetical protein
MMPKPAMDRHTHRPDSRPCTTRSFAFDTPEYDVYARTPAFNTANTLVGVTLHHYS